nr:cyanophycinase [uncultured Holophaga sp.]
MARLRFLLPLLLPVLLAAAPPAPRGTLVIVGGGGSTPQIDAAFLEAAGGKGARIGVIPVASESPEEILTEWKADLEKAGVLMVPLRVPSREEASSPALLAAARTCTGFWFSGGDQNRTADRVLGTPLHALVMEKYRQGAVVGGTSAGAAIMSHLMFNGEDRFGKEALTEIGEGAYQVREGLGFLPDRIIVDQHFLRRNRENRLISLLMDHRDHLGLGIDEATALVVKGGRARVLGRHFVMVFDPKGMVRKGAGFEGLVVHLLAPGQGLDLRTGAPLREAASR